MLTGIPARAAVGRWVQRLEPPGAGAGRPLTPLRVGVLTSHRAPGLIEVLDDALHGPLFEIVGVVSSEEAMDRAEILIGRGVPVVHRPLRAFHHARGRPLSDREVRSTYDEQLVVLLRCWKVDLVLCCGYLYVLTDTLLAEWPGAVLNVHHSDMLDRTGDGRVRFPGLRAVRDAIVDGARETRSTIHTVTSVLDDGPTLIRSWAFPVAPMVADFRRRGMTQALKAYAFAHQEWMLQCSWAALMVRALEIAALDRDGCRRGAFRGAPWELTELGQLRATDELVRSRELAR